MPSRKKTIKFLSVAIDVENTADIYDLKEGETKVMTDGKEMTFITLKNGIVTMVTVKKEGVLKKKQKIIDRCEVSVVGGENDGGEI